MTVVVAESTEEVEEGDVTVESAKLLPVKATVAKTRALRATTVERCLCDLIILLFLFVGIRLGGVRLGYIFLFCGGCFWGGSLTLKG